MSKRWKPEHGRDYYYIFANGHIGETFWADDPTDKRLFERGNCFKTKDEAEAAAKKVKALLLGLHEPTTDGSQSVTDCNQLPDWCKVGEWVYSKDEKDYARVQSLCTIGVNLVFSNGSKHEQRSFAYIQNECVKARLRTYNAEEMRGLLGKVVGNEHGNIFLVTAFVAVDGGEVCVDGIVYNADNLLECYTIDGKPAGVFEHLENGEWVE